MPPTSRPGWPEDLSDEWQACFEWIEKTADGRIVAAERQARWRPAWFLDLERGDGSAFSVYFRGDRGEAHHGAYALEHEYEILRILERHGIPVPHVYGFCEAPRGILMDKAPGRANLATAVDDAERRSVMEHYVEILARIHAIPLAEFDVLGLEVPRGAEALGLADHGVWERGLERQRQRPEPALAFLNQWIRRNVPRGRERASFVCADSGQFLFDRGRVTAVIDLELATFGDPIADLAGLYSRDLSEPLGDVPAACRHYAQVTGEPVYPEALGFHVVRFCTVTPFATAAMVAAPPSMLEYVQYLAWYLVYARVSLEIIGRRHGIEPAPVVLPEPAPTRRSPAHGWLAERLQPGEDGGYDAFERAAEWRVAEYLRRADLYGPAVEAIDLDEAERLLGVRPSDWRDAEARLEQAVLEAGPERDAELCRYFLQQMLRQEAILAPLMNELEGVRIQSVEIDAG